MTGLKLARLTVTYGRPPRAVEAVKAIDLVVPNETVVGLVGESGSGKSTVAKAIVGLVKPASGTITIDDADLQRLSPQVRARRVQMIFQDPFGSLNPRLNVGQIIAEALAWRRLTPADRRAEVAGLLELVALPPDVIDRPPRRLSGGQRQRVAIARAFAGRPDLIVADEITSALDVSVQAQVLNVLRDILSTERRSMLFISHNLAVVRYVCDYVAVMRAGVIVEQGAVDQVMGAPSHPYTRSLLASVPQFG